MSQRIRRFRSPDRDAMIAFAQDLPEHDLLFLGRDLKHPRVVEAWLTAIDDGWIDSLLAEKDGEIVGSVALVRDPLGWSAHVGEVRLLVSSERRGAGLGRDLLQAIMAVAVERRLAKLTAAMTPDQRNSVALFESLGFRGEALLKNQVRDRSGQPHDLAILSLDLARHEASQRAYGFDEA
ncbi:GNAT family N-acetyltransferase [Sphingomonas lycopersici]|uniref:GNAT family N-acetyltransferase n=1 Tax=Sphingomonas lycopersici TaxID=2951807 RepID=A0AA41Z7W6_9SPHN|nr:GNAT family N-acetyltransferase [Sphingomonas lycopersici]MCW6529601.1 GNAT family N-acetyltransferase [Sphingomonas lycopersici]MCW6534477.1 GNAT family N-acetyltransferase [Sphingomonas lycopersici]